MTATLPTLPRAQMARFAPAVRRSLLRARNEALHRRHAAVGSEHLLLGLLSDRAVTEVLCRLGVTPTDLREALEAKMGRGERHALIDAPGYSDDAREALWQSIEEADGFGHSRADTCHVLLGLVAEGSGLAATVLDRLVTLDALRHEVLESVAARDTGELELLGAH